MKILPASLFIASLVATAATGFAQTLVAAWTFDTLAAAPNTPTSIAASFGSGTIYGDGTHGSSVFIAATSGNEWTSFGGSVVGDPRPDLVSGTATSGSALSIIGGTSNSVNGKSLVFAFSLSSYVSPTFSFSTRGTSTGPTTHSWAYSVNNGETWTSFWTNTAVNSSTFTLKTTSVSDSAMDNAASVWVRLTVSGATGSSGNNRIDNFTITASAVPEPSSFAALAGVGALGFCALRRRRSV